MVALGKLLTSDVENNISRYETFFPGISLRSQVHCKVVSLKDASTVE